MRFGEKLSFLRKQRGMTQMELAEKLDISRQAVSRWERGTAEPSTEKLVSIGKLFDVSVDALMNKDVQLQVESAALVAVAEEKGTTEKHGKCGILIIVGIVFLVVVSVIAMFCIRLGKDKQNPVPMEGINKEAVDVSESVVLPPIEFINLED